MDEELNSLRDRLEERMPVLSKSQRRIASHLLSHYDQAAFLSAADLAIQLNVSEATVVRFAKAVGYDGFPQLKRVLQSVYRGEVTPAARLQHKLAELAHNQGHILTKVLNMEIQYLAEANRSVSAEDFDRAVALLLGAKRVFVYAGGPSAVLGYLLELRLRRFGIAKALRDHRQYIDLARRERLNLAIDRASALKVLHDPARYCRRQGRDAMAKLQQLPVHDRFGLPL